MSAYEDGGKHRGAKRESPFNPTATRIRRDSARVVVVDDAGHVLLVRIFDPSDTNGPVWLTPGGGIEAGEDIRAAAARELREETGLSIEPDALGEPAATCSGNWTFRGTPMYSVDWYFTLRTERFTPVTTFLTPLEEDLHGEWRWWAAEDLDSASELIYPGGLADLLRRVASGPLADSPIELPWPM